MVRPYLRDLAMHCWLFPGKLGRTEQSICLYHPRPEIGAEPLLRALEELAAEPFPAQRTVTFLPNNRQYACTSLRMQTQEPSPDLQLFAMEYAAPVATCTWTMIGLPALRKAIMTWQQGGEDFGVHPRHVNRPRQLCGARDRASLELWFWGPGYSAP